MRPFNHITDAKSYNSRYTVAQIVSLQMENFYHYPIISMGYALNIIGTAFAVHIAKHKMLALSRHLTIKELILGLLRDEAIKTQFLKGG